MSDQNNVSNCTDVKNSDGKLLGAVCVSVGKKPGSRDILLMMRDDVDVGPKGKAFSARSVTEMLNILSNWKVPFEERKRVHDFVTERLRNMEHPRI
jgi:hypothetical protein